MLCEGVVMATVPSVRAPRILHALYPSPALYDTNPRSGVGTTKAIAVQEEVNTVVMAATAK
jgi:hypothetical protein